jgi:hypothetical protein
LALLCSYSQAAPVESSSSSTLDTLLALQTSTASNLPEFFSISDKIQILVESTQKALNVEVTRKGKKLKDLKLFFDLSLILLTALSFGGK